MSHASSSLRPTLTFIRRKPLGDSIEALWFAPSPDLDHQPGQFIEIALPHDRPDSRGIRREFTIASSPMEPDLMIAVKFDRPGSTFKQALRALEPGTAVDITYVGGEFLLPENITAPVLLLAGGIGITPFRSMLQWLADTHQQRNIVLLYAAKSPADFVFTDVLEQAQKQGVQIVRLITNGDVGQPGERGRLDPPTIQRLVPDLATRQIYISGPEPMVEGLVKSFPTVGVIAEHIHRDSFPGYKE